MSILTEIGCKHYYTACDGTTEIANSSSLEGAINALDFKGIKYGIVYKKTNDELGEIIIEAYVVCNGEVVDTVCGNKEA